MAITRDQFEHIAGMLEQGGENPLAAVRARFPEVKLTCFDAEDMRDETPYRSIGSFDVFLVDTRKACWKIINEFTDVTALVISVRR